MVKPDTDVRAIPPLTFLFCKGRWEKQGPALETKKAILLSFLLVSLLLLLVNDRRGTSRIGQYQAEYIGGYPSVYDTLYSKNRGISS